LGIDRLSQADQKVARELAAASAENPFEPATGTSSAAQPISGGDPMLTPADLSAMRTLEIDEPGTWNVTVESRPAPTKLASKPILLGGGKPFALTPFAQLDSLLFVPRQSKAYAVVLDKRPGQKGVQLHPCDLASGKSQPPLAFPASIRPADIDPTGQWLVAHPDFFLGNKGLAGPNEVTLCKLSEKEVQHQLTWTLESTTGRTAPSLACFVGSHHLLTVVFPSKLVLWEAAKAKAVYAADLMSSSLPGISPGHQYLALPLRQGLYLVKAETGETVGKLPWEVENQTLCSFRPDGQQLAAVSFSGVQVFDLKTGTQYRNIRLPHSLAPECIDWVADGYLLLNGRYLVDLERRTVLWHYYHQPTATCYGEFGGRFWFGLTSTDRKQSGIFHTLLPTDDAKAAAAGLRPEANLVVKPGASVALRVNINGSDEEQQKVRDALLKRIKEARLVAAEGSKLVLEAGTESGESREMTYTPFGLRGEKQTTTFTEQISRVRLLEDDKVLWQSSTKGFAPFVLSLKEGQTLDDALAPYQRPNLNFFGSIQVPSHLARPPEKGAYGATRLTAQGPVPTELPTPKSTGQ
jgi:hypothetical protein